MDLSRFFELEGKESRSRCGEKEGGPGGWPCQEVLCLGGLNTK